MLEIVFSESACGSITVAQGYGKGKYHPGALSVFLRNPDGSEPTPEEIQAAQLRAEEKARRDWENAIPLDSKRGDVYCFDLALSIGDISGDSFGEARKAVLRRLLSVCPLEDIDQQVDHKLREAQAALSSLLERYRSGEELRIWYSHNPDELCGLYWLLAQLRPLKSTTPIFTVKLPTQEYREDGTLISRTAWGEVAPGEWGKYVSLQETVCPVLLASCSIKWRQLQAENAPLRVQLNGHLQSAPADIYDSFLLREIAAQPEQFFMPIVIGNVIGKYQLGIGDAWIFFRMETMIESGMLEVVQPASETDLRYRQTLRKRSPRQ